MVVAAFARPDVSHLLHHPPSTSYGVPSGSYIPVAPSTSFQTPLGGVHSVGHGSSGASSFETGSSSFGSVHPTGPIHTVSGSSGSNTFSTLGNRYSHEYDEPSYTSHSSGSTYSKESYAHHGGSHYHVEPVERNVYFYEAPEEHIEYNHGRSRIHTLPTKQRYNVIFVKAPNYASAAPEVIHEHQEIEEKTKVYVLVKHPEAQKPIVVPTTSVKKSDKPDVYVIKYKSSHEAEEKIHNSLKGDHGAHVTAHSLDHGQFVHALHQEKDHQVGTYEGYTGNRFSGASSSDVHHVNTVHSGSDHSTHHSGATFDSGFQSAGVSTPSLEVHHVEHKPSVETHVHEVHHVTTGHAPVHTGQTGSFEVHHHVHKPSEEVHSHDVHVGPNFSAAGSSLEETISHHETKYGPAGESGPY